MESPEGKGTTEIRKAPGIFRVLFVFVTQLCCAADLIAAGAAGRLCYVSAIVTRFVCSCRRQDPGNVLQGRGEPEQLNLLSASRYTIPGRAEKAWDSLSRDCLAGGSDTTSVPSCQGTFAA